jgi:hypothetical protein
MGESRSLKSVSLETKGYAGAANSTRYGGPELRIRSHGETQALSGLEFGVVSRAEFYDQPNTGIRVSNSQMLIL